MKKAALAAVATSLLVLVTACGGNDDTADKQEKRVISSMATAISKPAGGLLDADKATCVAEKFVPDIGVKKMRSLKAVGADDAYAGNGALADAASAAAYSKAVLSCVGEAETLAKLRANVTASYGTITTGVLAPKDVTCVVDTFIKATGVDRLFSIKFVNDTGAFNDDGAVYDTKAAEDFAQAIATTCVDTLKLQAAEAAAKNKKLSAAKLETCLKARIKPDAVEATLVAQLLRAPNADALRLAANKKAIACEKASKK
ncbi:hypothetical protein EFK50_20140 [Nocardioides marmoriginsengisoli]|uniref:Lipoprotein n=1 Tax=Nocardioides marmoriginsengisoli TaxID=661483 RepID=A0A3N0CC30_9ACTN|nr:hypothetical protein [Nocardioides marmoriginsengisoli]RNL60626.1 hypothetical protein EFK50_20140 [Nocardioides marmoriginsengisoli]